MYITPIINFNPLQTFSSKTCHATPKQTRPTTPSKKPMSPGGGTHTASRNFRLSNKMYQRFPSSRTMGDQQNNLS